MFVVTSFPVFEYEICTFLSLSSDKYNFDIVNPVSLRTCQLMYF